MSAVSERADGGVLVRVRATPNASLDRCAGVWAGADDRKRLIVKVTAPPDKGRANLAVIKTLARALGVPKSAVVLRRGDKSRNKTFYVKGLAETLEGSLAELAGAGTGAR